MPPAAADRAFARIRHIGEEAGRGIGATDVWHGKRLKESTQLAELIGRVLLVFVAGPWSLVIALLALAYHFAIEGQLVHSIMHGTYVGLPGAEKLHPRRYESLALPFQARTWGVVHGIHHAYASLHAKDPDTVHLLTRVHRDDPWRPWHVFNLFIGVVFAFECWAFDYDRFLKRTKRRARRDRSELWKVARYAAYNYALFPLLAAERWKSVLAVCVLATVVRNVIFVILQASSSVGRKVSRAHDRAHGSKRRGEWLRFQVETSKNFVIDGFWRTLCGGLDRHIEHHLYPRLPPHRLYAISAAVREACREAHLGYQEYPSVWSSLRDSAGHLRDLARRP